MTRGGFFLAFTSLRTTVGLLCVLSVLLLLNVALPQASVLGEEAFAELARSHPWRQVVLVELGLGRLPTSPVFLAVLGLFFLQLAVVLLTRAGPTWRRIQARPPSGEGLQAWARLDEAFTGPVPEGWSRGVAARILQGYGYRVRSVDRQSLWGLKHRTAPLGFLLFHLSFFLLCAGGTLIYYTRFVGTALVTEGQQFSGEYKQVLRQPPLGGSPTLAFGVEDVDPRYEEGEPTHLGAVFRFRRAGGPLTRRARINHPARWGATSILVQQAGLAPVLWLQDARGFTIDRVAVAVASREGEATEAPLGNRHLAVIEPRGGGAALPTRDELPTTPVRLRLFRKGSPKELTWEDELLFDGPLRPGEGAPLVEGRLVLEELRYWVGVQVVSERGGGLLEAGFVAGIAGLVWRLLLYRRAVGLTWDGETIRLVGRSESYRWRFRDELEAIFATVRRGAGGGPVAPSPAPAPEAWPNETERKP
jgi:hypothetical protein